MEDISHLTSPLDMLQCLLAVARNIYKSATEYSTLNAGAAGGGKKAELGADSFFPIWLFVLIHSDVRDLHRRVRMMKEYGLVKTAELAEHEYYLTCMEGGLLFVRQADPDRY
jgi:Vacuolar sorting protein 9 (VPS9) domain